MAIDRDRIVDEALLLLDEVGIDKLSTRKLPERLGVRPGKPSALPLPSPAMSSATCLTNRVTVSGPLQKQMAARNR